TDWWRGRVPGRLGDVGQSLHGAGNAGVRHVSADARGRKENDGGEHAEIRAPRAAVRRALRMVLRAVPGRALGEERGPARRYGVRHRTLAPDHLPLDTRERCLVRQSTSIAQSNCRIVAGAHERDGAPGRPADEVAEITSRGGRDSSHRTRPPTLVIRCDMRTTLLVATALSVLAVSDAHAQQRFRLGPTSSAISLEDLSGTSHTFSSFGGTAALITGDDGETALSVARYHDLSTD